MSDGNAAESLAGPPTPPPPRRTERPRSTSVGLRIAATVWRGLALLAALATLALAGLALYVFQNAEPAALFWFFAMLQAAGYGFAAWTVSLVCAKLAED